MIGPVRTQVDGLQELYSDETVVDCEGDPDLVDHSQRDSADLNKLMERFIQFGVGVPMSSSPPRFGIADMEMNLQSVLQGRDQLRDIYSRLDESVKVRYATEESFLTAVSQLSLDLTDPGGPRRRSEDQERQRRESDKAASERAALLAAVSAAADKRSASESAGR